MERVRVSSAVLGWSVSSALSVLGRRRSGSVTVIKSASSIRGVSLKWVHDRSRRLDNKSWHLSPHGCAAAVSADVLPASIFTPDIRQVQQLAVNLKPQSDGSTDPRYSTRGEQRRSGSTHIQEDKNEFVLLFTRCCLFTAGPVTDYSFKMLSVNERKKQIWLLMFHCSPWCRLSLIPDAVKCSGPSRSARSHSKHIAACRTGRDDSCFSYIVSLKMLKRRQDESFCDVLTGSKLNFF